mmetsp:Transcript_65666/g.182735  ORF Transcript_65666/g.182735 Transcript_65666/m.182735 type:complete len:212 (-) Transcript_65666:695-1330(-)
MKFRETAIVSSKLTTWWGTPPGTRIISPARTSISTLPCCSAVATWSGTSRASSSGKTCSQTICRRNSPPWSSSMYTSKRTSSRRHIQRNWSMSSKGQKVHRLRPQSTACMNWLWTASTWIPHREPPGCMKRLGWSQNGSSSGWPAHGARWTRSFFSTQGGHFNAARSAGHAERGSSKTKPARSPDAQRLSNSPKLILQYGIVFAQASLAGS